jgi:hypothetical protein
MGVDNEVKCNYWNSKNRGVFFSVCELRLTVGVQGLSGNHFFFPIDSDSLRDASQLISNRRDIFCWTTEFKAEAFN